MANPFQKQDLSLEELIDYFEIPQVDAKSISSSHLAHSLSYNYCKKYSFLPIKQEEHFFLVATPNPFQSSSELSFILGCEIRFCYCPAQDLAELIDRYFHREKNSTSNLIGTLAEAPEAIDALKIDDLLDDHSSQAPSIHLLNSLISEAITQGASDVHFEPVDHTFRIRYRIDGVLQNRHMIPAHFKSHMASRLKLMAKLDIAETRRPQDGRIKLLLGKKEVDFRVSTIPVAYGERIVLRILDQNNLEFGFDHLGMNETTQNLFFKMIQRSEGIILVTGPTGSGKTTTLYSAVSEIYQESLNIMTIEDPVEYKLNGIAQIGVQPKIDLTFSKGLKHILRQDPDVILIGEIRDLETAQIAIQAALTGHLVLSTLHTNDAASAITRLVDMGIEPYLLSSCVIGILAQRLVRTICPHCKEEYSPLSNDLSTLGSLSSTSNHFFRGTGCEHCYQTGYKGRQGIYELMPLSSHLKKQISESIDSHQLKECAIKEGMQTLKDQGKLLVERGITTVEEILRVALGMEDL